MQIKKLKRVFINLNVNYETRKMKITGFVTGLIVRVIKIETKEK